MKTGLTDDIVIDPLTSVSYEVKTQLNVYLVNVRVWFIQIGNLTLRKRNGLPLALTYGIIRFFRFLIACHLIQWSFIVGNSKVINITIVCNYLQFVYDATLWCVHVSELYYSVNGELILRTCWMIIIERETEVGEKRPETKI